MSNWSDPAEFVFGEATDSDVAGIVDLVQSAYRGDSSRQGWTTEADLLEGQRVDACMVGEILGRANALVLTARQQGQLIGCCELQHRVESNEVYLGMFAVSPELQAGGVGRRVLARAERIAVERWDARRMVMTVIDARPELIGWYERRGYERTGETDEFPYGDDRFGVPLRDDLRFVVLSKALHTGETR